MRQLSIASFIDTASRFLPFIGDSFGSMILYSNYRYYYKYKHLLSLRNPVFLSKPNFPLKFLHQVHNLLLIIRRGGNLNPHRQSLRTLQLFSHVAGIMVIILVIELGLISLGHCYGNCSYWVAEDIPCRGK